VQLLHQQDKKSLFYKLSCIDLPGPFDLLLTLDLCAFDDVYHGHLPAPWNVYLLSVKAILPEWPIPFQLPGFQFPGCHTHDFHDKAYENLNDSTES